jgi:hypothetical protein
MVQPPRRPGVISPTQKTVILPFATNRALTVPGTGTSYDTFELDDELGGARHFGPALESITGHTFTHVRTTNARWKVVFWWSYDGNTWSTPVDLFTEISALGQVIHTPYTLATTFAIHMRYGLGVRSSTGSGPESVNVSGALAFVFRT